MNVHRERLGSNSPIPGIQPCNDVVIDRRGFAIGICAATLLHRPAVAQTRASSPLVGFVTAQREASLTPYLAALLVELAELGYRDGENLRTVVRYGDDVLSRVSGFAAELVAMRADLIVAQGAAAGVLRNLKLPIPVVYVMSADPVTAGFAESLARPTGNMTGMTHMAAEMNAKRLDLLRELVPGLRDVALIANPQHPGQHLERENAEQSGTQLGLTIHYNATTTRAELERAFEDLRKLRPQGLLVFADGFAIQNRKLIADFGIIQKLPVLSGWAIFAQSGALCTYGPRLVASYRRLASFVDRILKGAKPEDLPIERPSEIELVINLKTARSIGVDVPRSVLVRADEVIE